MQIRHFSTALAGTALAGSLLAAVVLAVSLTGLRPAFAQDEATEASASAAAPDEPTLTDDDLDTLLGPVALYPDTLLTQIMMASTYPLDVVKADRFIADSTTLSDQDRATAAQKQDWDPSVQALAAGFPTIVTRMADNIDWTEQLGDAVLSQTDDVLDTVQRLRDEASANGHLATNDAQVVNVSADNTISIEPANPEIVYVPTYDSQVVYSTPAPATSTVIVSDNKYDAADALATGAIIFGSAMILNEIFDDDDPWHDYWRGPPAIDWRDGDFHPRPDIDINGDVNFNRNNNFTNINRKRVDIDRNNLDFDRNNLNFDRNNIDNSRDKIGNLDRDQLDAKFDKGFKPAPDRRDDARNKIAQRKDRGDGVASMRKPGTASDGLAGANLNRPNADRPDVNRPKVNRPDKAAKPAALNRPANVSRPAKANRPTANRPPGKAAAFEKSGGNRARAASARGHASRGGRRH